MNELNFYQTFQNIFDHSDIIGGRFSIATGYGSSLDDEKVGDYIVNTLKPKTYPLVALFPPVDVPGDKKTAMKMKMLFVLQEGNGSTGIKDMLANNTSGHSLIYDWKDMSECAYNFIDVLKDVSKVTPRLFEVKTDILERFSFASTAKLSGVALSFSVEKLNAICINAEYQNIDFGALLSKDDIHPQHKH